MREVGVFIRESNILAFGAGEIQLVCIQLNL